MTNKTSTNTLHWKYYYILSILYTVLRQCGDIHAHNSYAIIESMICGKYSVNLFYVVL